MILLKGIFLILSTSFLAQGVRSGCFLRSGKEAELKLIEAAKKDIIENLKLNLDDREMEDKTRIVVVEKEEEICSRFTWGYEIKKKQATKETFLGSGSYGSVLKFEVGGIPKAVKYISFGRSLKRGKSRITKQNVSENCFESIIKNISKFKLKEELEPSEDQKIEISTNNVDFSSLISEIEKDKTCEKSSLEDVLIPFIEGRFEKLRAEFEASFELSAHSDKYDNPDHRTFPKFDYCIIDDNLNVYFVMEMLGNSSFELRTAVQNIFGLLASNSVSCSRYSCCTRPGL
jgi:hypothetical protein